MSCGCKRVSDTGPKVAIAAQGYEVFGVPFLTREHAASPTCEEIIVTELGCGGGRAGVRVTGARQSFAT